jgi:hypothetical protein
MTQTCTPGSGGGMLLAWHARRDALWDQASLFVHSVSSKHTAAAMPDLLQLHALCPPCGTAEPPSFACPCPHSFHTGLLSSGHPPGPRAGPQRRCASSRQPHRHVHGQLAEPLPGGGIEGQQLGEAGAAGTLP